MISRRQFLAALPLPLFGGGLVPAHAASPKARIVVIGGGFGGAAAAKYLRLLDPSLDVTLIERNPRYTSCPLSNEVLAGERRIETLQVDYRKLTARGVRFLQDEAVALDPVRKTVATAAHGLLPYDFAIVAPGVDFDFSDIEGMSAELAATRIPHAWKAGEQTLLLHRQLAAMPENGRFLICVPKAPFRCPPGPYERAALAAMYCKQHGKKKAKILILDANDNFSKRPLFEEAYKALYGYGPNGMIEWVPASAGGAVEAIDPQAMTVRCAFDEFKGDVINLIPPHQPGKIARDAGLANTSGWCGVKPESMESTAHKDLFVIGDAVRGGDFASNNPFPKSAHMANGQAKIVAAQIVARVNGLPSPTPIYTNTCYSVVGHGWGFSVAALWRVIGGQWVYVPEGSGISPTSSDQKRVPRSVRRLEAEYADGWLRNILADSFA